MTDANKRTRSRLQEIAHYEKIKFRHKAQEALRRRIANWIDSPDPNKILTVAGPTGVGKSTLVDMLEGDILSELVGKGQKLQSTIPVFSSSASPGNSQYFEWNLAYRDALTKLQEPSQKHSYRSGISAPNPGAPQVYRRQTTADLRRHLLTALEKRSVGAWLLDEASVIGKGVKDETKRHRLDLLKDFSDRTDTKIVTFGTYEINRLQALNGQLSRRITWLEFARYRSTGDDAQEFANILHSMIEISPIPWTVNASQAFDFFYRHTFGCVGMLHDHVVQSVLAAHYAASPRVKRKHFESTKPTSFALEAIAMEILEGEQPFRGVGASPTRRLLETS